MFHGPAVPGIQAAGKGLGTKAVNASVRLLKRTIRRKLIPEPEFNKLEK